MHGKGAGSRTSSSAFPFPPKPRASKKASPIICTASGREVAPRQARLPLPQTACQQKGKPHHMHGKGAGSRTSSSAFPPPPKPRASKKASPTICTASGREVAPRQARFPFPQNRVPAKRQAPSYARQVGGKSHLVKRVSPSPKPRSSKAKGKGKHPPSTTINLFTSYN